MGEVHIDIGIPESQPEKVQRNDDLTEQNSQNKDASNFFNELRPGLYKDPNGFIRAVAGGAPSLQEERLSLPQDFIIKVDTLLNQFQVNHNRRAGRNVRMEIYLSFIQRDDSKESLRSILERAIRNIKVAKQQVEARSNKDAYASLVTNLEPEMATLETLLEMQNH